VQVEPDPIGLRSFPAQRCPTCHACPNLIVRSSSFYSGILILILDLIFEQLPSQVSMSNIPHACCKGTDRACLAHRRCQPRLWNPKGLREKEEKKHRPFPGVFPVREVLTRKSRQMRDVWLHRSNLRKREHVELPGHRQRPWAMPRVVDTVVLVVISRSATVALADGLTSQLPQSSCLLRSCCEP
jgi:hypothetical protein